LQNAIWNKKEKSPTESNEVTQLRRSVPECHVDREAEKRRQTIHQKALGFTFKLNER
jgi:hypothetical protein